MSPWTLERAQSHLLSLELFGMRLGLERMHRLLDALGSPQCGLRTIHVVGTNGKSSTVRMAAAILDAHGLLTGAFLSPHLSSFAERVRIGGEDLEAEAFAAAVERAAAAAELVERDLEPGDRVTQFELLTAAALTEFAAREVDVAVVEAGLGGRHDATNVLAAPVAVLTSVGLEHTRWLGTTLAEIAREKLAVLAPGATLVVGELEAEALREARAAAQRLRARLVRAGGDAGHAGAEAALAGYQRRNFAVAAASAQALIGPLDPARVADAAAGASVPGRLQTVGERPLTVLDGAHNPAGVEALVATLDELVGRRPLVAVVSILDDKDAAGMLARLLPRCTAAVLTRCANPRSLSPEQLEAVAPRGATSLLLEPEPRRALERARELAGADGAVLATGSIHLVGELLDAPGRVVSAR